MTHQETISISRWGAGVLIALATEFFAGVWWARGLQAELEIVRLQGQYTLEKIGDNNQMLDHRIASIEDEIKEIKKKLPVN